MSDYEYIKLKCPSCGGTIESNSTKDNIFRCPFCGTQILVEKCVHEHYEHSNNFISANTVHIKTDDSTQELWDKYSKYLKIEEYTNAYNLLQQILEKNPCDLAALCEKIRIKECSVNKSEIMGKAIHGEKKDQVLLFYANKLYAKEIHQICILSNEATALNAINSSRLKMIIDSIYDCAKDKKREITWEDLPSDTDFVFVNAQSEFDILAKKDIDVFESYLQKCFKDNYHISCLGYDARFFLLNDKKHVIFFTSSCDGDYSSFLGFTVQDLDLLAPKSFVTGTFQFKPSFFFKKYKFSGFSRTKLVAPCKISLAPYRNGEYYALVFNDNQIVHFRAIKKDKDTKGIEERGNEITVGWMRMNGFPFTINYREIFR